MIPALKKLLDDDEITAELMAYDISVRFLESIRIFPEPSTPSVGAWIVSHYPPPKELIRDFKFIEYVRAYAMLRHWYLLTEKNESELSDDDFLVINLLSNSLQNFRLGMIIDSDRKKAKIKATNAAVSKKEKNASYLRAREIFILSKGNIKSAAHLESIVKNKYPDLEDDKSPRTYSRWFKEFKKIRHS